MLPFLSFYLPFTSASAHNTLFRTQTNIHPVVDIKKMLAPVQVHMNGTCWVNFSVCARLKVSRVCWGVSLCVCRICLPVCPPVRVCVRACEADVLVWTGRSWEVRRDLFLTLPWFPCPCALGPQPEGPERPVQGLCVLWGQRAPRCGSLCLWALCSSCDEGTNRWRSLMLNVF